MDLVTGQPPDEGLPAVVTSYATEFQDWLREVHHQVCGNLKIARETTWDCCNAQVFSPVLQEGQLVLLHTPRRWKGLSSKLQSTWKGLYTVEECITDVTAVTGAR